MNDHIDLNDGPWREVERGEDIAAETVRWDSGAGRLRYWVRDEPVPPLPTEPYTVICAEGDGFEADFSLLRNGIWAATYGKRIRLTPTEAADRITSFEVLSEPRAVTAKAVLDRVMITGISGPAVNDLYREFGVTDV